MTLATLLLGQNRGRCMVLDLLRRDLCGECFFFFAGKIALLLPLLLAATITFRCVEVSGT
ncbi:hypothetical protein D3C77_605470 [compost metagenome]